MEKIVGRKAEIIHIEKQKGDIRDTFADTSKVEKILKWKPKIGINKDLEKYLKYYLGIKVGYSRELI